MSEKNSKSINSKDEGPSTSANVNLRRKSNGMADSTMEAVGTPSKGLNDSLPQQFLRFADYFVICGLDLDSGLEPDRFAGA